MESEPDGGMDYLLIWLAAQCRDVAIRVPAETSLGFGLFADRLEAKAKEYRNHEEGCDCDYCMR